MTASRKNAASALFVSPASLSLRDKLDRLAASAATVLIIGETGTGKELAARHLHAHSARRSGPFVAVNCGALTDSLAEAELFGYEKGAYTGAIRTQEGWFEAAQSGTLLLDEIGELPPALQVKLLRVLQEREVTRVGSRTSVPIDVRVIAATNIDLAQAARAKDFREDLLFRLNVATVVLPPLRERGAAEIEALALHFLQRYAPSTPWPDMMLADGALAALRRHLWPGNIRELENVIQRAVVAAREPLIGAEHLELAPPLLNTNTTLSAVLKPLLTEHMRQREPDVFKTVIRALVESAFEVAQGSQVKAAEHLGVSRHELRTRLSHLGLIAPRRRRWRTGREPHEFRIGYQSYGSLSLLKADTGLESRLESREIRVSWVHFSSGPQLLESLHSGAIDFGATGEVPPIFAQAHGVPLVYVGHDPPSPSAEALIVPRDSKIVDVTDLRGKRIALNRGSNVHYLLVQCLEAHGLSLEDVQPVYVPPQEAVHFVETGAVEAAVAWDPYLTVALRAGAVRVLLDGMGLVSNHQFHVSGAEFARRYPDTINSALKELRKISRMAVHNPARAAHALADELGIDSSVLEIVIRRLTHGAKPLDISVIREQQKIADRFYALGLIPRAIAVRDAVWAPAV